MLSCQKHEVFLPEGTHYLNCGYMSPLCRRVEEAGLRGVRSKRVPSEIGPADFFSGPQEARRLFAGLVGARDPGRVAIIPSVSYGLATAARNLPIRHGQCVVVADQQFPSNVFVWRRVAAAAGATVRTVTAPPRRPGRGEAWNAEILDAIDGATAVVALGQVHWTDGTLFDLEAIGTRARDVGAALVVDGSQSVGAMPLDVERLGVDALVCAGYKWLFAPYGIGAAYYGPRLDGGEPLEETWLARVGSDDFRRLVEYRGDFRPGAARYDMGEASSFVLMPMLVAALEQVGAWAVAAIADYCRGLTAEIVRGAEALGFTAEGERWRAGHLVGLGMPAGLDPGAVRQELAVRGVHVSVRGDVLRVSPHVYNDGEDVAALLSGLRAVVGAGAAA